MPLNRRSGSGAWKSYRSADIVVVSPSVYFKMPTLKDSPSPSELDAIMHTKYARDAAKLTAWRSASRVERAPVREKKPDSATTPPKPNP